MSPAIEVGDIVLVNKMHYGPRILNIWKFFKENKIEYHLFKGKYRPEKGDAFVFNWPDYNSLYDRPQQFYGSFMVKRCLGSAGEIVRIMNERNNRIDNSNNVKQNLFPYDSILNWTIDNYGPLWIPGKAKTVKLTAEFARHYKDVLLYEGYRIKIKNDSAFLNGKYSANFTFENNYYFMLGDNLYGSMDSRYWGFVPEKNIVGKVVLVLISLDPNEPWYRKFRWDRFLKKV